MEEQSDTIESLLTRAQGHAMAGIPPNMETTLKRIEALQLVKGRRPELDIVVRNIKIMGYSNAIENTLTKAYN